MKSITAKANKALLLFMCSLFSISLFSQKEIQTEKNYFDNGTMKSEIAYRKKGDKRIREGESTYWYVSGELKNTINYKRGKLNGERFSYWKNGKVKRKDLFKKGKLLEGTCFDENGKEVPYYDFEVQSKFPGGQKALDNFIKKYLYSNRVKGKLILEFTIEPSGAASNVKIIKDTYPSLQKEIMQMFQSMPLWEPAKQDGNPVSVKRTIPIEFK